MVEETNLKRMWSIRKRYDQRTNELVREVMPTQYLYVTTTGLVAGTAGELINSGGFQVVGSGTQAFLIAFGMGSSSAGNNFNNTLGIVINSTTIPVVINTTQGFVGQVGDADSPLAYVPPSGTISIVALNAGTYTAYAVFKLEQTGANIEP